MQIDNLENLTDYEKDLLFTLKKYIKDTFDEDDFVIEFYKTIGISVRLIDNDLDTIDIICLVPNKIDIYVNSEYYQHMVFKNDMWSLIHD